MVKRIKDRQYNGQKKKTDNTMVKRKRTNRQTWPLYCLSICPFSFGHYIVCLFLLAIVLSVFSSFSIFWPLYCLSYFDLCLLIFKSVSFGHCIVCPSLIYAFWLPLWYLVAIVSSVLLWCMPSDYPFGIFWPVYRLSYFDLCLLIAPNQRGNQKAYSEVGQTIQWQKDTKWVIRRHTLK
jgi:hypothetical protein